MNCRRVAHQLTELNEGSLSFWQRLGLRMHMGMCPACKAYVHQMDATTAALRDVSEPLSDEESRAIAERARQPR